MLDWGTRFDDLHHYLATQYGVDDREAVEILLAALVSCPRTAAPWLILETNWFSRRCDNAWFSFGGHWQPRSLAELRALRPRQANELIREWLDESPQGRLFVEPDYERMPHYRRIFESRFLLARSLRVRSMTPRSGGALAVDHREQDRRADTLATLVRQLVEDRVGARAADPPVFRQPPGFLYHAEILQRLSPWFPDWSELLNSLASLAVHHAYLYGRTETTEADWKVMSRLAADSVPVWIHRMIHYLNENPASPEEQPARVRVQ
jgi:hypothetical protein